jgi:hypothetical protein
VSYEQYKSSSQSLVEQLEGMQDIYVFGTRSGEVTFMSKGKDSNAWGRASFVNNQLSEIVFVPDTIETYRGIELEWYKLSNIPEEGLVAYAYREYAYQSRNDVGQVGPAKLTEDESYYRLIDDISTLLRSSRFEGTDEGTEKNIPQERFERLQKAKSIAGRILYSLGGYNVLGPTFPIFPRRHNKRLE